jgi:hypothetical protein
MASSANSLLYFGLLGFANAWSASYFFTLSIANVFVDEGFAQQDN